MHMDVVRRARRNRAVYGVASPVLEHIGEGGRERSAAVAAGPRRPFSEMVVAEPPKGGDGQMRFNAGMREIDGNGVRQREPDTLGLHVGIVVRLTRLEADEVRAAAASHILSIPGVSITRCRFGRYLGASEGLH